MLRRRIILAIATVLGILIPAAAFAATGSIDATNYRSHQCTDSACTTYTEVYWRTTHGPAVSITDTGLSGYIWSSQYGWINLDPGETESRDNPTTNRWFYYHAEASDGAVWAGPFPAEVEQPKFEKCTCLGVIVNDGTNPWHTVGFRELDTATFGGVNFVP